MFKQEIDQSNKANPSGNTSKQDLEEIIISRDDDEPSNLQQLLASKYGRMQISKNPYLTARLIREAEEKTQIQQKERDEKIQTIERLLQRSYGKSICSGACLLASMLSAWMLASISGLFIDDDDSRSLIIYRSIWIPITSAWFALSSCSSAYFLWKHIKLDRLKDMPKPEIDPNIAALKKISEEEAVKTNKTETVTEESGTNQEKEDQPLLLDSHTPGYGSCAP